MRSTFIIRPDGEVVVIKSVTTDDDPFIEYYTDYFRRYRRESVANHAEIRKILLERTFDRFNMNEMADAMHAFVGTSARIPHMLGGLRRKSMITMT